MRVIAGKAKGRKLKTTRNMKIRPTSDRIKEAVFNMLAPGLADALFLDIFAGVGSIGIEALSRGAKRCVFIEKEKTHCKLITDNLVLTGFLPQAKLINADVYKGINYLKRQKEKFNYVFLDPPYDYSGLGQVLTEILNNSLLFPGGEIIIEQKYLPESRDFFSQNSLPVKLLTEKRYGGTLLTIGKT